MEMSKLNRSLSPHMVSINLIKSLKIYKGLFFYEGLFFEQCIVSWITKEDKTTEEYIFLP